MEISVIIPVHNAGEFLGRCLKSVLDSLEEARGEVLIVDDHSTDQSLEVAERFRRGHLGVIRVLHCNTRGASAARNLGVRSARGKYIWFIDADDYIDKSAVRKLIEVARENQADVVMMGAEKVNRGGTALRLPAIDAKSEDFKSRFVRYGMGPWQVLIRREWWAENGLEFREGIIHEDMELMSSLVLYTDRFASVGETLYYYCDNPESVLHKSKFSPHIFDIFPALRGLYKRFEAAGAVSEYHDELEWFFIWNLLIDSAKDFRKFPEGRSGFKRSREMLKEYFPGWRKNRFLHEKPLKLRMRVFVNYMRRR